VKKKQNKENFRVKTCELIKNHSLIVKELDQNATIKVGRALQEFAVDEIFLQRLGQT
jgi:hypothetical protein